MTSLRLYGLVATGGVALLGVYALLRRKPKTPEEIERERRKWLEGTGRITDGTVIDVLANKGQYLSLAVPQPLLHMVQDGQLRVRAEVEVRDTVRVCASQLATVVPEAFP